MVTAEATSGNQGPRPDRPSRMKPYVGGLAMALLLATCTNAGEGSTANQGRSPRECQADAGAATDLASEPDWASYGRYERWHDRNRSEEHPSDLQSLIRISYAVFSLTTLTRSL